MFKQPIRTTLAAAALFAVAGFAQAAPTAEKPTAREATTPTTVKQTVRPADGSMNSSTMAAGTSTTTQPAMGSAPANAAVGSGSSGTVDGRKEGSTNANSMGEPVRTDKAMKADKKMHKSDKKAHGAMHDKTDAQANAAVGSGSSGTVEGRTAGSTNSNSKGEPVKTR